MHNTTIENLETMHRWTLDIVRADSFLEELETLLPEDNGNKFGQLTNSWGCLNLTICGADSISEAAPYLRAVRTAGFRRTMFEKQPESNSVLWKFSAEAADGKPVSLGVVLQLPNDEAKSASSCRYVKVGKKEVDDVRLMCGDELAKWQEQQA